MMKLYYAPGTCSLAAHIVLEELGVAFEPIRLDLANGDQRAPDYLAINPKGRVPALVTDQGVLTESPAILTFLADSARDAELWPSGAWGRAQALSFVTWCSGTVHGVSFAGLFRPARFATDEGAQAEIKVTARQSLEAQLGEIEARVAGRDWVFERFSIADLYPLIFRRWAARIGVDMSAYPGMVAHASRVAARPAAARAIAREGIQLDR